jgi:hypothetical protein
MLAFKELVDINIKYIIYNIKYRLDHHIIEIVFNILVLVLKQEERLLFKNIP